MTVIFDESNEVSDVVYKSVQDHPSPFYRGSSISCQGRHLFMGGENKLYDLSNQVYEYDMGEYQVMPYLNESRRDAGCCYHDKILIVCGGYGRGTLDSIEMLKIEASDNDPQWMRLESSLPSTLRNHSIISFKGKIILTGGTSTGGTTVKKVWEGTLNSDSSIIDWNECESMKFKREEHFAMNLGSKLLVLGGRDGEHTLKHIEYFDGVHWTLGPKIPFKITTINAQCILDRMGRILILSNDDSLIVFDTKNETFKHYENFGLRENRRQFCALLQ